MGKAEITALESLLGGGKRRRRLGKKDSRFGPELTEVQQRKNARNIAKSQSKRRSGWEDPNEKLGRESAKQFEDENPGAAHPGRQRQAPDHHAKQLAACWL
jgi:hypothetical protein